MTAWRAWRPTGQQTPTGSSGASRICRRRRADDAGQGNGRGGHEQDGRRKASAVADRAIHTKAMSEAQTKLDIAKQAQKRSEKLASELGSWIAEKNANASAQAVCRAQISDAQALLDKREEVEAGSQSYGKLSARREELLGTAALIQPKEEKLRDVMAALSAQRKKKGSLEAEKLSAQATCWSYEQALADYDELERKAADLAGASERLTALEEQDEQYLAADQEAMKLLQTKNAETARIQSWLDIKENEVTHIRSRAIMLETCGCPVENPECRFLQDAVEAKKKLPAAETELETYRQQAEERAEQLDAEYQAAKEKGNGPQLPQGFAGPAFPRCRPAESLGAVRKAGGAERTPRGS